MDIIVQVQMLILTIIIHILAHYIQMDMGIMILIIIQPETILTVGTPHIGDISCFVDY